MKVCYGTLVLVILEMKVWDLPMVHNLLTELEMKGQTAMARTVPDVRAWDEGGENGRLLPKLRYQTDIYCREEAGLDRWKRPPARYGFLHRAGESNLFNTSECVSSREKNERGTFNTAHKTNIICIQYVMLSCNNHSYFIL